MRKKNEERRTIKDKLKKIGKKAGVKGLPVNSMNLPIKIIENL